MVIGIDASRANKKRKTGTEWYSYYLIKHLAKIDKKNKYILYTNAPLRGGLTDLTISDISIDNHDEKAKYRKGQQIIKSPYNNFKVKILKWPFSHFWTLGRLSLEMLINKPDVLFVPAHGLPLIRPKNTVNTIHDVAFEIENNVFEKEKIGSRTQSKKRIIDFLIKIITFNEYSANSFDYLKWSTRYSLKHSSEIIAVSEATKADIIKIYNHQKKNINVIHNGFNNCLYKKKTDKEKIKQILDKYGIDEKYILYVGRLEKKKNTPLLIEAFAKAKHFDNSIKEKLVLVGDASFGHDQVRYTISEFHLDREVIMPGWIEEKDMPYILSGATAFIFPTRHEGFGIPVIQAFGCGIPVLASNLPVLREIGADSCLYFDYKDKDDIARTIEKIINNEVLRTELGAKGIQRSKKFSWQKSAEETLKVLNSF